MTLAQKVKSLHIWKLLLVFDVVLYCKINLNVYFVQFNWYCSMADIKCQNIWFCELVILRVLWKRKLHFTGALSGAYWPGWSLPCIDYWLVWVQGSMRGRNCYYFGYIWIKDGKAKCGIILLVGASTNADFPQL